MALSMAASLDGDLLGLVLAAHGIGELPLVLSDGARWYPRAARDAASEQVRDELVRLAWSDRRGRLDTEVAASLRIVCAPQVAFYGWINTGDQTIGVLSAAVGRESVLAIRRGTQVTLAPGRRGRLAETLVAQTPVVAAGSGAVVRVRVGELVAVDSAGRSLSPGRVGLHRASMATRAVAHLAELPATGTGELTVAVRDELGRRRTPDEPLRYVDTCMGRYFHLAEPGDDTHLLVGPADRAELTRRLTGLHRSLGS